MGVDPLRGLMYAIFLPQPGDQTDYLFEISGSYFRAASPTSIERNIYSVRVPIDAHSEAVERPTPVTDTSVASYYSASFSPSAGFYLLTYEGPGVPFQKVIKAGEECGSSLISDTWFLLILGLSSECAAFSGQHGAEQDCTHV